jgi:hypothetical protein
LETAFSPASFPGVSFMVRSSPVSIFLLFELQLQFYTAHALPNVTAVTLSSSGMIPVLLKGTAVQCRGVAQAN